MEVERGSKFTCVQGYQVSPGQCHLSPVEHERTCKFLLVYEKKLLGEVAREKEEREATSMQFSQMGLPALHAMG